MKSPIKIEINKSIVLKHMGSLRAEAINAMK
jgi:hypothetical protein